MVANLARGQLNREKYVFHKVMQIRTDDVQRREPPGTWPVVLKIARLTGEESDSVDSSVVGGLINLPHPFLTSTIITYWKKSRYLRYIQLIESGTLSSASNGTVNQDGWETSITLYFMC